MSMGTVEHPTAALQVDYLRKDFTVATSRGKKVLTAVESLDLKISPGETVAIVGESGSGKSTAARCILRLVEPTSGVVSVGGRPMTSLPAARRNRLYQDVQLVFQDSRAALDPLWPVQKILEEPLKHYFSATRAERQARIRQLMSEVGLDPELLGRRPGQLSGGQRQRIAIARALAVEPKVIILDEPTASLDASARGQMLRLLRRIQGETGVAYLFISHDLQVVRHIAHRVIVMYLGAVLEVGPTAKVFDRPAHPYTQALISAMPVARYRAQAGLLRLTGEIPSPMDRPTGCLLAGRCPLAIAECHRSRPSLVDIGDGWRSACPVEAPRGSGASADNVAGA
jgi:oligopeptide/dipeptide ABC transporter ATP-binding protein